MDAYAFELAPPGRPALAAWNTVRLPDSLHSLAADAVATHPQQQPVLQCCWFPFLDCAGHSIRACILMRCVGGPNSLGRGGKSIVIAKNLVQSLFRVNGRCLRMDS